MDERNESMLLFVGVNVRFILLRIKYTIKLRTENINYVSHNFVRKMIRKREIILEKIYIIDYFVEINQ